jgi:cytidine deaminase
MIGDERTASATLAIDAEEIAIRALELGGVLRAQDEPWLRSLGDRDLLDLLPRLLPAAASLATAPISGFNVGAIAVGGVEFDRRLYFGANLEIARAGLSSAVHAEQSAIVNAWMHDEPRVSHLAISAAPSSWRPSR